MSQNDLRPAVVITGASGGIGQAMAEAVAAKGQAIVLIGRSEERLAETAAAVTQKGGEPFILNIDLLSEHAAGGVEDFLDSHGLVCDVLVNSAGRGVQGLAASLPLGEQMDLIELNVRRLVELTLTFVPGMVARRGGGVINLGSVAGLIPGPQMAVYFATKSFVSSFSQALSEELRRTGVTVTCVMPGPVETGFLTGRGIKDLRFFRRLPALSAEQVAKTAWREFRRGRRRVLPGISSKLAALVIALVPSRLILRKLDRIQRRKTDLCPCGSGKQFVHCCGMAKGRRSAKPETTEGGDRRR